MKGWKDLPIAGLIVEPGNAEEYHTGDWRSEWPKWDEDTCTSCLLCWIHCPDSSIVVKDGKMTGVDELHCKGCGICASICPVTAIEMVPEESR